MLELGCVELLEDNCFAGLLVLLFGWGVSSVGCPHPSNFMRYHEWSGWGSDSQLYSHSATPVKPKQVECISTYRLQSKALNFPPFFMYYVP